MILNLDSMTNLDMRLLWLTCVMITYTLRTSPKVWLIIMESAELVPAIYLP